MFPAVYLLDNVSTLCTPSVIWMTGREGTSHRCDMWLFFWCVTYIYFKVRLSKHKIRQTDQEWQVSGNRDQ